LLAKWFREHGWSDAKRIEANLPGRDIQNMPGLAPEVKARDKLSIPAMIAQARANAGGDLAFGIYRPNGYGPHRIAEWVVFLELADFTELLRASGYSGEKPGS